MSALVPPWKQVTTSLGPNGAVFRTSGPYRPIWDVPAMHVAPVWAVTYQIDWGRLVLTWIAVGCLAGVALTVRHGSKASKG